MRSFFFGLVFGIAFVQADTRKTLDKLVDTLEGIVEKNEETLKKHEEFSKKMGCWCKKMEALLGGGYENQISALKQRQKELAALLKKLHSQLNGFKATIDMLEGRIVALAKQGKKEENDMDNLIGEIKAYIQACDHAIGILENRRTVTGPNTSMRMSGNAFLESMSKEKSTFHNVLEIFSSNTDATSRALSVLDAFSQSHLTAFLQDKAAGKASAVSSTDEVVGWLKHARDDFARQLAEMGVDAEKKKADHAKLLANLQKELARFKLQLTKKEQEIAQNTANMQKVTQEIGNLVAQHASDIATSGAAKATCGNHQSEYVKLQSILDAENRNLQQAIDFLRQGAVKIAQGSAFNKSRAVAQAAGVAESFVQIKAHDAGFMSKVRGFFTRLAHSKTDGVSFLSVKALNTLKNADMFGQVITLIDSMMELIKEQEATEKADFARCQRTLAEQQSSLDSNKAALEQAENLAASKDSMIRDIKEDIVGIDKQIKEKEVEVQQFTQQYKEEHAANVEEMKYKQEAVQLVKKAMTFLQNSRNSAFLQGKGIMVDQETGEVTATSTAQATDPWAQGNDYTAMEYENNEEIVNAGTANPQPTGPGSEHRVDKDRLSGPTQALQGVISTLMEEMHELEKDMQQGQRDYTETIADMKKGIDEKNEGKNQKTKAMHALQAELADLNNEIARLKEVITTTSTLMMQVNVNCAPLLSSFQQRSEYRTQEMSNLQQAKGLLKVKSGHYDGGAAEPAKED